MARINYYLKRPIELVCQGLVLSYIGFKTRKYLDISVKGIENLPECSSIIAPNHCIGIDSMLVARAIPRFMNYLIQSEGNYGAIGKWAVGGILVNVDKRSTNSLVLRRVRDYLSHNGNIIGIFPEGPTKNLYSPDGRPLPLEKREHYSGAVHFALSNGVPIVPIGVSTCEDVAEKLWEVGGDFGRYLGIMREYTAKNGKIPYRINIGKPIRIEAAESVSRRNKKELTEIVRQEIIRLARQ
jgi:1-acyl-sn-glycerol-3-phosphate acyltransferase